MKMIITSTSLLLLTLCSCLLSQDQEVYIEAKDLRGAWIRVIEEPVVGDLYRKDTMIYYIGLDTVDCRLYDCYKGAEVISYKKSYGKGQGVDQGYLYREDFVSDYDYDEQVASISYDLRLTSAQTPGTYSITFSVPRGYSSDTLVVRVGDLNKFGLRKAGGDHVSE